MREENAHNAFVDRVLLVELNDPIIDICKTYLSFASAITGVKGSWALLIGLSNICDSSLLNSILSSGYSLGRVSMTEGCQFLRGASCALKSWLPKFKRSRVHVEEVKPPTIRDKLFQENTD